MLYAALHCHLGEQHFNTGDHRALFEFLTKSLWTRCSCFTYKSAFSIAFCFKNLKWIMPRQSHHTFHLFNGNQLFGVSCEMLYLRSRLLVALDKQSALFSYFRQERVKTKHLDCWLSLSFSCVIFRLRWFLTYLLIPKYFVVVYFPLMTLEPLHQNSMNASDRIQLTTTFLRNETLQTYLIISNQLWLLLHHKHYVCFFYLSP